MRGANSRARDFTRLWAPARAAEVVHDHLGPRGREGEAFGPTDPAPAPGDDGDLVLQSEIHAFLPHSKIAFRPG